MADVVGALLQELLGFAQGRAAALVASTFRDATALTTSLRDDPRNDAALRGRLDQLVTDLGAGTPAANALAAAVAPHAAAATAAVAAGAAELAVVPFTIDGARRLAAQLATAMGALDAATALIATEVAAGQADVEAAVLAIAEPWAAPLRALGAGAGAMFDALARQILGAANASRQLASGLTVDRAAKELRVLLAAGGERAPVPGVPAFTIAGASLEGFLRYGAAPAAGLRARALLRAGLRIDPLLDRIIAGAAAASSSSTIAVQLDTARGLTLGEGGATHLSLDYAFSWPGIELRDFALAVPTADGATIDLTTTIAGSLGGVLDVVVEGGGLTLGFDPHPAPGAFPLLVTLRAPDAAGIDVKAPLVSGGGYLRRKGSEYGGALDLRFAEIGVTATGLLGTDPFSLVLVMGVHFFPVVELSWGFTLNGVGGLLALERRVDSDALVQGISHHVVDTVLFPDDPIAAAPTILDALHDIFPPQSGGFVVGPIAEIGWGSQARFVVAKLGVVIALPDPKIILLGALRVAVPSAEVPPELAIVDLKAEVYGEISPEHLLLRVALSDSKVANMAISGDMGLLLAWTGDPQFAISVGGFHPHYTPPPELGGLRRITLDMTPYPLVTLHAEGYFALTSNSLQFGAMVKLIADIGIASGEGWIGLDALFRWAPRIHFEADLYAGLAIRAFGHSVAGVEFRGHLEGTTPWVIDGRATIDVWYMPTVHFDVGPFTWGRSDPTLPDPVSPRAIVAEALGGIAAWSARLPADADMLVHLARDEGAELLVHPLGGLEVRQIKVPLETTIDRVGSNPVTEHRVDVGEPLLVQGGVSIPAGAVSHVTELFAPGLFLDMTDDQRLSRPGFEPFPAGVRMAATPAPRSGAAIETAYEWETCFPHEELPPRRYAHSFVGLEAAIVRAGPVARASRATRNAYAVADDPVRIADPGAKEVRHAADLGAVSGAIGVLTTTAAARAASELRAATPALDLELVAAGVAS